MSENSHVKKNTKNEAMVNQQVKLLVRAKKQKFISTQFPCMHTDRSQLSKENILRDRKRRDNSLNKKPIWETWGTQDYSNHSNIGLFGQQQVFGNHLSGQQWVQEQKRRQKEFIVQPGQIKTIQKQNAEQVQYTYIEPANPTEKLDFLRRRGYQFQDGDFPPNDNSLNGEHGLDPEWEVIQWKRIRFMVSQAQIFEGKVQPGDIKQGYLGDCYFLAGLGALAQRPDRIFNLFVLKQKNQLSFYSVKILFKGKWRMIDLDDSIPFVFSTPAFSRTVNGQLWVVLLEKAWAKLYGSYKNIEAGFPEEPLHDLTGAPIKQFFLTKQVEKSEENWKYLMQASLKQYAMVASSNTDSDQHISPTGIFRAHAYTFLNAIEIQTRQGKQRIVQLRNTWGRGQFKGKWADDDPFWNEVDQTEKYRVRYKKDCEDGIFFMSYPDFIKQFRILTIAEINDNSSYVYESCYDPNSKGVYFALKILHQANYCLQVDKTPQRSLSLEKQKSYRYPQSILQIGRINETCSQMLEGCSERKKTMYKTYKLFPGDYVAYVRINFDPKYETDFQVTLAVYSQFSCGVTIATAEQAYKLTGKKNEWDGIKKTKPQAAKLPFSVRSTTFIQIKQKKQTSQNQTNQNESITGIQVVNNKSYRNQSEFERKNPLVMFGFQNLLAEQTPCYKQAVGQLQKNWKYKSKSKSKQKSKQINTHHQHSIVKTNIDNSCNIGYKSVSSSSVLSKKIQELRAKSKQKSIVTNTTNSVQKVTTTKQTVQIIQNTSKTTVQYTHSQQTVDSRSYAFVQTSQMKKVTNLKNAMVQAKAEKGSLNKSSVFEVKKQTKLENTEQKVKTKQNKEKIMQTKQQIKVKSTTVHKTKEQKLERKQNSQNLENMNEKMKNQEEKVKAKPAYIEDLIHNVLGFQIPYRKQLHIKEDQKKQQASYLIRNENNHKTIELSKITSEDKTHNHSHVSSKKISQTSIVKDSVSTHTSNLKNACQTKVQKQTKQQKLIIKVQQKSNQEIIQPKVEPSKESIQQEKYKKEVRDSLKKRRRQVDVLKYPEENKQDHNIIFDLWPKLMS